VNVVPSHIASPAGSTAPTSWCDQPAGSDEALCDTENVWPPMFTLAVRFVPLLTDANTTAVPLPVPDAPLVTVSHVGSLLVAVHEHQLPVVTATDVEPPPAASVADPGEIA
jgi:hypothetical protein